jgi:hypothetical protein
VLDEAVQAFHAVLDRHSLADITYNSRPLRRILNLEPAGRAGR